MHKERLEVDKAGLVAFPALTEFTLMKIESEIDRMAWQIIEDCRLALLTTADRNGWPHATWMNFQMKGYLEEIFSITAPTTQKIANLRENPRAEWMLSNPSLESVISISGETRIIEGDEVQQYWDAIPGKLHAYYRQYNDSDDFRKFVVISTKIAKVVLTRPAAYKKIPIVDETGKHS
jgi:general stress protein 26